MKAMMLQGKTMKTSLMSKLSLSKVGNLHAILCMAVGGSTDGPSGKQVHNDSETTVTYKPISIHQKQKK